jgi:ElaB/YqjD/DUF883 family membrane-anchored ribosome-binding protein
MPATVFEKTASVEDALREVSKIRSKVSDAVEDGVRTANQAMKRSRHAAEDLIEDVRHSVKQRPFEALGLAFGAGILAGGLATWLGFRRH